MTCFALLAAGWIWTGLFLASGMDARYAVQWWVEGAAFCSLLFAPVALVLGIAGLRFDARKRMAGLAVVASLASLGLVLWIRP